MFAASHLLIVISILVAVAMATRFALRAKRRTRGSVEARLQELTTLKKSGLISESEYESQRVTILKSV